MENDQTLPNIREDAFPRTGTDYRLKNIPSDVVDVFDIPDELAKELADVMNKVSILKDLLMSVVDVPSKFGKLEEKLLPFQERYTTLKNLITYQYVPTKFQTDDYLWVFPGYEIAGPVCWIQTT